MDKEFYIYILTNKYKTVFYTGFTSDLLGRVYQHKNKLVDGFTKKYNVDRLVYFEHSSDAVSAIEREKRVKDYRRSKKIALIEAANPQWKDLYEQLTGKTEISRPSASK